MKCRDCRYLSKNNLNLFSTCRGVIPPDAEHECDAFKEKEENNGEETKI